MNIFDYISFFHDGSFFHIQYDKDKIDLYIGTSEIDVNYIRDPIAMSKWNRIQGILHLEKIIKTASGDPVSLRGMLDRFDDGEILDFEIEGDTVQLGVRWSNFPPKPDNWDYTMSNFRAEKIWWENIPDLEDSYQ